MQMFFFHMLYNETIVRDPEGSPFCGLAAASAEAFKIIRELAADRLMSGTPFLLTSINICADGDQLLASVTAQEGLREILCPFSNP